MYAYDWCMKRYNIVWFLCWWLMFIWGVHAQTTTPDNTTTAATSCITTSDYTKEECKTQRVKTILDRSNILDTLLKWMYLLLWPVLMIAGFALDNKLIFGESLWLDTYLRKFWTIMVIVSYVILWVSILRQIGSQLYKDPSKITEKIKWLAKNTIIAAILIPMSYWIIQQLVSISTILVFMVWALPLNVNTISWESKCPDENTATSNINNATSKKNDALCTPILQVHTRFNLAESIQNKRETMVIYSTTKDWIMTLYFQCPVTNNVIKKDSLTEMTEFKWWFVDFKKAIPNMIVTPDGKPAVIWNNVKITGDYCAIKANQLIQVNNDIDMTQFGYTDALEKWAEYLQKASQIKVETILDKTKSSIWPLYAIYASILDFGSITTTQQNPSPYAQLIELLMKTFHAIMLFIPLLWLCIVLMVRVWYIWVFIAFSPLIVLYNTIFKPADWKDSVKTFDILWEMNLDWIEMVKLIMQPAIVMFAVSLWLILIATLKQTLTIDPDAINYLSFWVKQTTLPQYTCFTFLEIQTICMQGAQTWYGLSMLSDFFNRWVLQIFWIFTLWALFFAALKSNKLTEKVAKSIETISKNYIWQVPVIPWWVIPWVKDAVWYQAAWEWAWEFWNNITKVDGSEDYKNKVQPTVKRLSDIANRNDAPIQAQVNEAIKAESVRKWINWAPDGFADQNNVDNAIKNSVWAIAKSGPSFGLWDFDKDINGKKISEHLSDDFNTLARTQLWWGKTQDLLDTVLYKNAKAWAVLEDKQNLQNKFNDAAKKAIAAGSTILQQDSNNIASKWLVMQKDPTNNKTSPLFIEKEIDKDKEIYKIVAKPQVNRTPTTKDELDSFIALINEPELKGKEALAFWNFQWPYVINIPANPTATPPVNATTRNYTIAIGTSGKYEAT